MSRIACLRIPRFQIVVHQKHEPELRGKPLALIGGRSKVMICSPQAGKNYVRPGMRLSEARAVCAQLVCREYDDKLYISAHKEMLAHLVSCSPRISGQEIGIFLMDADGLLHMGGEGGFCRNALRSISRLGYLDGTIGIADSAFAAIVAAQNKKRRWHIVPAGCDRQFLSRLSVNYLPVGVELKETLRGLGIEYMGQLTALPADEIERRFADEGLYANDLAQGIDQRRPTLPRLEMSYQCFVDIGGPVESLNDTLFVIKSMLERLVSELKQKSLCAEELVASFYQDDELFEERPIRLIAPSNQSKFLLEVLRLSLENKKLEKEFTGVRLTVTRTVKESITQLELLSNEPETAVSSESFLYLIQKLSARFGDNVLVQPLPADQYMPESAGTWAPVKPGEQLDKRSKISAQYIEQALGKSGLVSGLVLKRYKEPLAVLMELQDRKPQALTCQGEWFKIQTITTPECLSGLWWETPIRKTYYTALITGGKNLRLVMLVYDHERQGWFLEGEYD